MSGVPFVFQACNTINLAHRIAGTPRFKTLFQEGMGLVEEVAAYLDGPGREEARSLGRTVAAAYAAESMRLTTRLMQIASWLLVQRAVIEGDLGPEQAEAERHKVRLRAQEVASGAGLFAQLPARLRDLTERSLRLQSRVLHLDRAIRAPEEAGLPPPLVAANAVDAQRERIRMAFATR